MSRLLLFTILLFPFVSLAQGKLMLVGGGSEKDASWGWSNEPYAWAVAEAPNQRVAIISYSESSDPEWLPDYFLSLGAEDATNFVITDREEANAAGLYQTLISYDLIFFKGGDQAVYYEAYRDTELSRAVNDIFENGGVIAGTSAGMAILSGIVYSAEDQSVYPDQALGGEAVQLTTLRNDMFNFLPGFLSDTHFAERGRLPRLVVFVGEAEDRFGGAITGIGVDDQTAFCIDADRRGTVYGTGAVTIAEVPGYTEGGEGLPEAEAVLTALVHGQVFDLGSGTMESVYMLESGAPEQSASIQNDIYLTGSASYSHNRELWERLLGEDEQPVIVVGPDNAQVRAYVQAADASGRVVIHQIPDADQDPCESVRVRNHLREGSLLLITGNNDLQEFMDAHPTGHVLKESVRAGVSPLVMTGDDAMRAGEVQVLNVRGDALNAYQGQLEFTEGLAFLPSSIVITESYDPLSGDYYENTTAAGLFAVVDNRLAHAVYLNERAWVRFYPENGEVKAQAGGEYATMLVRNESTQGALADQPVNASGDVRNQVGFDRMRLFLIGENEIRYRAYIPWSQEVSLPELLPPGSFQAAVSAGGIRLSWEYFGGGSNEFEIERAAEGGSFSRIASVSSDTREFLDESVEVNVRYAYRIRLLGAGQASCYAQSGEAVIITSGEPQGRNFRVFPNPAVDRIRMESQGFSRYCLSDLSGRRVRQGEFLQRGEVNLTGLRAGIYLLSVTQADEVIHRKIRITDGADALTQN